MEQSPSNEENEVGRGSPEQESSGIVPRIYASSLSDYNAGHLHGAWIEAAQDEEALAAAIAEMLKLSTEPHAEEFAIFDYDGFWPLRLAEQESLADVSRIARGIAEHGPAFAHYANLVDPDQLDAFEDCYLGHYEDLESYAESFLDDLGFREELDRVVPELIAPYVSFNVGAFARDMELSGSIATSEGDGGIYVFDPVF